jgi:50S ribosomal subunit-associated GTPase HflX
VLVIDASCSDPHQLSMLEQLNHLRTELEYDEVNELSVKPWIVAVNKIDLLDSRDGSSITSFVNGCRRAGAISVVQTSAGTDKTNVSSLKRALIRILTNIAP